MEEPLMNLHPKTSHEKLLWERSKNEELINQVKTLGLEIGMLRSELDELKDNMKSEEVGALILKNKKLKESLKDLENKIRDLKRENALYLEKIIKLQTNK
jgi:regulator of replication initiation timing